MKLTVPKKLKSYVRSPQLFGEGDGNPVLDESDLFLLGLTKKGGGRLLDVELYDRVSGRAPECMPFFLELLVPFPVLAMPAAGLSDWGAVTEARRVADLIQSRFVLLKRPALRGVFGRGENAVAGLGGSAMLDLGMALRSLPADESWVQTSLIPSAACAFQTTFVGPHEFLGWKSIEQYQRSRD
jgi:hypothetical protein